MLSELPADESNAPLAPVAEPIFAETLAPEAAEIDPEEIVEEAEQLLREGAPHDFDVLVIGAGPGGLAAALGAAGGGLHVAVVEAGEVGGVCLNRGCIPTKTLLESVGVLRLMRRAKGFGIDLSGEISPDFGAMQARKAEVVAHLRAHTRETLEEAGVEILQGHARFVEEDTLEIENEGQVRRVTAVSVVIAVGGIPSRLPIPGADLALVVTSDEILEQNFVPTSLVVAGAGAVGIEFASIFAELGSKVTIIEKMDAIMAGEDEDIQAAMGDSLREMGIEVHTGASMERIEAGNGVLSVVFEKNGIEQTLQTHQLLMATGRSANLEGLGLAEAGIEVEGGKIKVDERRQTGVSGVYAIGDCIRRVGWAHQAALEGREAADGILGLDSDIDARFVPACYYTFPEVASVGLSIQAARELGIPARAGKFPFRANERAAALGDNGGFVKLVIEEESERLLGCQIIGPHATELINEVSLALRSGATAGAFADALHAHPTFAEVLPGAARAALEGRSG
ncbi:MAG: dihydrolipoyl dehydrogenase [Armatimonadetes bacterium]|nr:dihydrolipoyl dehydrogenase [Armatimonadota bacterium]